MHKTRVSVLVIWVNSSGEKNAAHVIGTVILQPVLRPARGLIHQDDFIVAYQLLQCALPWTHRVGKIEPRKYHRRCSDHKSDDCRRIERGKQKGIEPYREGK